MKKAEYLQAADRALAMYEKAHIVLTEEEKQNVEVADFGLGKLDNVGLEIVTYVNTDRVCAKEMVLFPHQTCPEHMHVETNGQPGKEETFRVRYGVVHLYVTGERNVENIDLPATDVTVFHEVVLRPGQQYTIHPRTWHWFRAGAEGAVVSEFSTHSTDETDVFTDKNIVRAPKVE